MDEAEREALLLLAYLLFQNGRLEKAETILAALAEAFPRDGQVLRLLADCLLKQGKPREALPAATGLCAEPGLEPEERRMAELLRAQALWGVVRETPREDLKAELADSLAAYLRLTEETERTGRTP
jgi:uncharacterized protein HemY